MRPGHQESTEGSLAPFPGPGQAGGTVLRHPTAQELGGGAVPVGLSSVLGGGCGDSEHYSKWRESEELLT